MTVITVKADCRNDVLKYVIYFPKGNRRRISSISSFQIFDVINVFFYFLILTQVKPHFCHSEFE